MSQSREQDEFVRLVEANQQELLRYILPMVPCHSDALDVLQETVAQLWEKFDRYDRTQPFEPWARAFGYTQVLKFRKLQQRRDAKVLHLDQALIDQMAAEWDLQRQVRELRAKALEQCIEKLSPREAQLLEQRYWSHSSVREAAQSQDVPEHTFYRLLHRIRIRLRKCIEATIAAEEASL